MRRSDSVKRGRRPANPDPAFRSAAPESPATHPSRFDALAAASTEPEHSSQRARPLVDSSSPISLEGTEDGTRPSLARDAKMRRARARESGRYT
jgi:hypothetical protein